MPRKPTPAERREAAIQAEIARSATLLGLRTDADIATYIGWQPKRWYARKAKGLCTMPFNDMCAIAGKLKIEESRWKEICSIGN